MQSVLRYWRAVVVAIAPLLVYVVPREWLFDEGHTVCLWHNLTGNECWGCGMTRALASVCYLDFAAAWEYHKGVVIVAPLMAWLWVKWVVRLVRSGREAKSKA